MRRAINYLALMAVYSTLIATPVRADDSNAEAIKAFRAHDYQKAEQLYRDALTHETDNVKLGGIYRNLAVLYEAQGKDASEFTKKADEINPAGVPHKVNQDALPSQNGAMDLRPQTAPTRGVFSSFGMNRYSETSGFGLNFQNGNRGGAGIGGNSRYTNGPFFPGGYGYGSSLQTPNGASQFTDSSPIILSTPNGRPVIIDAPGPNIYTEQRRPDGDTTTIINRTY